MPYFLMYLFTFLLVILHFSILLITYTFTFLLHSLSSSPIPPSFISFCHVSLTHQDGSPVCSVLCFLDHKIHPDFRENFQGAKKSAIALDYMIKEHFR